MNDTDTKIDMLRWALHDAPVTDARDRLTLVALAGLADATRYANPTVQTLAGIVLCEEPALRKALERLVSGGFVRVVKEDLPAEAAAIPESHRPTVYKIVNPGEETRGD